MTLSDLDRLILFGDGSGRPLGLFGQGEPDRDLHPGHMTRQRRRAAERAARKDKR